MFFSCDIFERLEVMCFMVNVLPVPVFVPSGLTQFDLILVISCILYMKEWFALIV